jgi:hypothetical protein
VPWISTRLRSAEADPHIIERDQGSRGAGPIRRSGLVRTLSRAGVRGALPWPPLPGSRVRRPPGERPSSRPCSTDESVAMSRRFQRCIARVSHGLVSPSRSSLFRCCPAVARCRSTLGPSGRLRAEARGVPWEGVSVRSPGPKQVGPFPRSELRGGFRSIPSWVARDAPNGDCSPSWFRRYAPEVCPGARVASRCPPPRPPLPEGVSTGPSRRPPWGF